MFISPKVNLKNLFIKLVISKVAGWQQDDELALQRPADDPPARGLPSSAELGPGDAASAQLRRDHVAADDHSEAADDQQFLPPPPAAVLQPAKFPRRSHDALPRCPATVAIPTVRPAAVAHVQQLAQVPADQPPVARPPPDPALAPPHPAPHGDVPQPEKRQGAGSPHVQSAAGSVRLQPIGSHRADRESNFVLLYRKSILVLYFFNINSFLV